MERNQELRSTVSWEMRRKSRGIGWGLRGRLVLEKTALADRLSKSFFQEILPWGTNVFTPKRTRNF